MARVSLNGPSGTTLAEVSYDEESFYGVGGNLYPRLGAHFRLTLRAGSRHGIPETDYSFTCPTGHLALASNNERFADALPVQFYEIRQPQWGDLETSLTLEFPIDALRLATLERARDGGDLNLRVDVALLATQWAVMPEVKEKKQPRITLGPTYTHRLCGTFTVKLARSTWLERVLPQLGYGKVHILELPAASIEACESAQHAFLALKQAQQFHLSGHYDEAVGKCRLALEKLLTKEPRKLDDGTTREVPIFPTSWQTRIGKATYDWLSAMLTPLKNATNAPHHSPNPHYDQLESQMILAVVTSLVAYAARVLKEEPPSSSGQ